MKQDSKTKEDEILLLLDLKKQEKKVLYTFPVASQSPTVDISISSDGKYGYLSRIFNSRKKWIDDSKTAELVVCNLETGEMKFIPTEWTMIINVHEDFTQKNHLWVLAWDLKRPEGTQSSQVWNYNLETGEKKLILDYDDVSRRGSVIYPDGKHLLVQSRRGYWIYNLETGARASFRDYYGIRGQIDAMHDLEFSPESYHKFMKHTA